jgi:L-asparaginase
MQSQQPTTVVVLGTGGTIAGTAARTDDNVGYRAAQLGVDALVDTLRGALPDGVTLESEQVAQLNSKDMTHAVWAALAHRVAAHLARAEVAGIVVTHGTDTLEETACFLQRLLAPAKPVVLTCAMRPATSLLADGPQNLRDAITVAAQAGARGVVAVVAGAVHGALDVRKAHTYRLDAFASDDAGPIGCVEEGRLRRLRDWPAGTALGLAVLGDDAARWPRVEIVASHAGADGRVVDALVAQGGVDGLVVAATGGGSVHEALEAALVRAQAAGVAVLRASRVGAGPLLPRDDDVLPAASGRTPAQARVELLLQLLARRAAP